MIQTRHRELEARTEELRRKDYIIAALTERIPELEVPSEPREAPVTPSEDRSEGGLLLLAVPDDRERVSWWRRLFSLD